MTDAERINPDHAADRFRALQDRVKQLEQELAEARARSQELSGDRDQLTRRCQELQSELNRMNDEENKS